MISVRSYTLRSTALMFLIDLVFGIVLLFVLGLLLGVLPEYTFAYFLAAAGLYLVKTVIWLGLRIPLIIPIDRWEREGSRPDADDPRLIRGISHFPYDFTLFYGVLLTAYYSALMLFMIHGPGPIHLGEEMLLPGLLFASSIGAGAIAIGIPVNLLLTSRFSRKLSERRAETFDEVPGKEVSLRTKIVTFSVALGCAPSLLLFAVQSFVGNAGLHQEADRTAVALVSRLVTERESEFGRWALTQTTFPFVIRNGQVRFFSSISPPEEVLELVDLVGKGRSLSRVKEKRLRYVVRVAKGESAVIGVAVAVPEDEYNWMALFLVLLLALVWPLLTAVLMEQTIARPVSVISSSFHRIVGRGRTEETDRVPIFFKDEVGRLAFNANRTIATLTEARAQLEKNSRALAHKNRELEEAYRTKGEFLANMSHELRTPLNAIIGFSRLMTRKVGDDLPPRQRKNLDLITASGEQLLTLVNDLLDFEKIEAGKLVVQREETDLRPLLQTLKEILSPVAQGKGLELEFDLENLPQSMLTDADRLRQILTNLVINAIKYSDSGRVTLTALSQDGRVVFEIADQGIGMTPDELSKIFTPFHQVDASETRERGGVGLGLAIVARLVRLLRGRIEVSSVKGQGSIFTASFPLNDDLEHLQPVGSGAEVLVVDDNLDYLESMHHELSEAGYRVYVASSGSQALELLETTRPEVILLDIVMPDMDGWEVLRKLRKDPNNDEIPVIITSVLNDQPVGLDVDFSGWLSKPFDFSDLKRYLTKDRGAVGLGQSDDILIVEDDPQTSQLLEQVFEESGVRVQICPSESEAMKRLEQGLPAVLVLDLKLEEGSGWSVLTYLRSRAGSEKTQVFIYTACDIGTAERVKLSESLATIIHKHGKDSLAELVDSVVKGGSSPRPPA